MCYVEYGTAPRHRPRLAKLCRAVMQFHDVIATCDDGWLLASGSLSLAHSVEDLTSKSAAGM